MRVLPLTALLLAVTPAVADAASGWTAPRSVTRSGSAYAPSVALTPGGGYGVAYVRGGGGSSRSRVELRLGRGDTLRAPVLPDRSARWADETALAFDGRDALLAWRRPDGRNHRLRLARVTPGGRATVTRLTGPGESAYGAAFVPGTTTLAWNRRTSAWLRPIGSPGAAAVRLPAGAVFDVSIAARTDGSRVAVWPAGGRIWSAELLPGATAFGTPVALSAPGGAARTPQVVTLDDGGAVAVWTQNFGLGNRLVSAARPAGAAWGSPVTVVAQQEGVFDPRAITASNGEVAVAYLRTGLDRGFGSAAGTLRLVRLGPDARRLGAPASVSDTRARGVALARDASAVWVAWSGGDRVRLRRVAAGGILGRERVLSGGDRVDRWVVPAFSMSRSGRGVLAYPATDGRLRLVSHAAGV